MAAILVEARFSFLLQSYGGESLDFSIEGASVSARSAPSPASKNVDVSSLETERSKLAREDFLNSVIETML